MSNQIHYDNTDNVRLTYLTNFAEKPFSFALK